MPRRPSKKSRSSGVKPRSLNRADGKLDKWNTISDIPLDEEDQFHTSKDKILLEGEQYEDDNGDDDEVFALKGLEDEEEEDYEEDGGMEEDDMDEDDEELQAPPSKKKKKKKEKSKKKGKEASSSASEQSESEEETWGRGKAAYYSSNVADLESDDEEGNELEEQEARRLQSKAREDMGADDFGLNDAPEIERKDELDDIVEPTPSVLPALPTDKKALIHHLEKTSPETLALARDWEDTALSLMKTKAKLEKIQSEDPDALSLGMLHLHYQTLLSYTTTLAFYLHLRASEKYAQRPELLNSHPILQRLLTLKQSLSTLEDLDFAASDSEEEYDDGDDEEEDDEGEGMGMNWEDIMKDGEQVWSVDRKRGTGMDPEELVELLKDAEADTVPSELLRPRKEKPPKKKRKTATETLPSTAPVFDLEEPDFVSSHKTSSRSHTTIATPDAYGEATHLQEADAADKSARKKSLRFHTSKIESASARRQGARNQAAGGDDDIPYRERKKEKDGRLAKEAANRVKHQGGMDLDNTEPPPRTSEKRTREDDSGDDDEGGPDGYYELVKKKSKEKKEKKKREYEEAQAAARPELGTDTSGPRSLTRAILANKGLTPHRPKSVRNPRVKKRQKFEKAKKKISSQKAVYKGGISDTGRYDGEKSGISKVVKSVRLG